MMLFFSPANTEKLEIQSRNILKKLKTKKEQMDLLGAGFTLKEGA